MIRGSKEAVKFSWNNKKYIVGFIILAKLNPKLVSKTWYEIQVSLGLKPPRIILLETEFGDILVPKKGFIGKIVGGYRDNSIIRGLIKRLSAVIKFKSDPESITIKKINEVLKGSKKNFFS